MLERTDATVCPYRHFSQCRAIPTRSTDFGRKVACYPEWRWESYWDAVSVALLSKSRYVTPELNVCMQGNIDGANVERMFYSTVHRTRKWCPYFYCDHKQNKRPLLPAQSAGSQWGMYENTRANGRYRWYISMLPREACFGDAVTVPSDETGGVRCKLETCGDIFHACIPPLLFGVWSCSNLSSWSSCDSMFKPMHFSVHVPSVWPPNNSEIDQVFLDKHFLLCS